MQTRYFYILSMLLVILLAVGVGHVYQRMIGGDMLRLVETHNETIAHGFINSVWRPNQDTLKAVARMPSSKEWQKAPGFLAFTREAFRFFEEMPIVKMSVYLPDNSLLVTSNQAAIIHHDATRSAGTLFDVHDVMEGNSVHETLNEHPFTLPSGGRSEGTLVHSIIPIVSDKNIAQIADANAAPVGMIEIYTSADYALAGLDWLQWASTLGIIFLFLCLLIVLMLISRRSESIIAKQHELNLELTATAAAAEAESRDKAQFLANISHELRTPLNAIIGFSEILRTELQASIHETHLTYLNDIHSSGSHLLSLINDILDYSKAEAGKLELQLRETDLTKLIKNSMRVVFPRAEEAQITLAEDLPKEHIVVRTDSKKLKQALLNLLSNSVKFTAAGGEVRVTMWENLVDDTISIEVRDTGIGIAEKDISKVLTPFGQAENNLDRKYEGTGLGLPLAKKFVEIMGGQFKIESKVGVGTSITLIFPAEKISEEEEISQEAIDQASA